MTELKDALDGVRAALDHSRDAGELGVQVAA